MPRKLDRAPRKALNSELRTETTCTCTCKTETDAKGQEKTPSNQAGEQFATQVDIG